MTPEPERKKPFGLYADWDWQRFLFGLSFERGDDPYLCINIGFVCVFVARGRWNPWGS